MKKIVLNQLNLRNFRGIKELEINFRPEKNYISGDNGTGKSSILDAYLWLLFGKDALDRKDYQIRPIINGKLIRKVDCEISAELEIDGTEVLLKRVFKEKWVKPRGEMEEVFKGNETETFWNNVPVNVTEYQKKINEIINESIFKMVSIGHYFPTLDWRLQRDQLFQLAGTITDNEIATGNKDFELLLDKISGKSMSDFKKEIQTRKRKLKEELDEIQPRIDQTQKVMPEMPDTATLNKRVDSIKKELSELEKASSDVSEAIRLKYEKKSIIQLKINDLKKEQQQLKFELESKANEESNLIEEERKNLNRSIEKSSEELKELTSHIQSKERELEILKISIQKMEREIVELREKWMYENGREYNLSDRCDYCGQELPEHLKAESRQMFADAKAKKLDEINTEGVNLKTKIENSKAELESINKQLSTEKQKVTEIETKIKDDKIILASYQHVTVTNVIPDTFPKYKKISESIAELEKQANAIELTNENDNKELDDKKLSLQAELREIYFKLHDAEIVEASKKEIENLENRGKELAQQIASLEKEEYTIQEFTKKKIDECEKRINNLFDIVTFRLFDYTIDGNASETCVPLVEGIPYDVANSAGQVNAGLAIIKTLQKFYGVQMPIFCDRAESVTKYYEMQGQITFLKVVEGSLTIK